jgi:hypothetical protein
MDHETLNHTEIEVTTQTPTNTQYINRLLHMHGKYNVQYIHNYFVYPNRNRNTLTIMDVIVHIDPNDNRLCIP